MSLKQSLRNAVHEVAPRPLLNGYRHLKLVHHARQLSALRNSGSEPQLWMEALWNSHSFRPLQRKTEILRLTEILRPMQPSAICEIGAAGGGTTFLLANAAHEKAIIVTIDLEFSRARRAAISKFAAPGQNVVCLQADSQRDETLRAVIDNLGNRQLDFLLIDGDHSHLGVASDFRMYGPLVRPGGIIAFHDIVPVADGDVHRHAGDVPAFWQDIKTRYSSTQEIVEDSSQSGAGVGILYWR